MRARKAVPVTDTVLATTLGVPRETLAEWSAGRRNVPRDIALLLGAMSSIMRSEAALAESGLPECAWMRTRFAPEAVHDAPAKELTRQLWKHRGTCEICQARERRVRMGVRPGFEVSYYGSAAMRALDAIQQVWYAIVWVALAIVAVTTDLWREPVLWVVVALPLLFKAYFRWRRS